MTVDISKLEAFFKDRELPETHKLSKCETITNVKTFVTTHIATVKALNGREVVVPYVERLRLLAKQLK